MDIDKAKDASPEAKVKLIGYFSQHAQCSEGAKARVQAHMAGKNLDAIVKEVTASCTWKDGHSWQTAFDFAIGSTLDGMHVCNNDARLQLMLWEEFAKDRTPSGCDPNHVVCSRPAFFFDLPAAAVIEEPRV